MSADVVATVVAGLLVLVGLVGIVVPVLPGTITVLVGLLLWAVVIGGPIGWVTFAIGAAFCLVGVTATYVLTGRTLKRASIPNRSVVIGLLAGVVGMFVIPVVGLPIGFAAGLFLSELARVREPATALRTSGQALRATGIGMLVEFGCASAAGIVWMAGAAVRFL
ncbi:hypothetical protein GA0111570_10498 [Raineyella antarctica]|uniref:DUF456 domain-containing protein n=1 Tax=Raineyella antarctica TaxID=1577474 RepID=A0A1G6GMA9_9ACTN|nr:DUF456 domain-containing protein [Raineyella antarctica]SDB83148.1 hypothetical protein GA0111570_10498 [Raineyella antarctica]